MLGFDIDHWPSWIYMQEFAVIVQVLIFSMNVNNNFYTILLFIHVLRCIHFIHFSQNILQGISTICL